MSLMVGRDEKTEEKITSWQQDQGDGLSCVTCNM